MSITKYKSLDERTKLQQINCYAFLCLEKGLKTGIYYLRTKAKAAPQQFTIEPDKKAKVEEDEDRLMCVISYNYHVYIYIFLIIYIY